MSRRLPWHRRARALLAAAPLIAVTAVLAPAGPAGAAPPSLPNPNSNGLTLSSWVQVTSSEPASVPRLLDATVTTGAIFRTSPRIPIKVRILLPANYQTAPATPYPVLYLLHGGGDGFDAWSLGDKGNIKNVVAGTPFNGIVVMPEGGRAGWYSNWRGNTIGGFAPQWEDFHIRQLVPWIDANFNTIANRNGRALAGLSMGGLGALEYGGRFSSTFSRIGAFSAGTDLNEAGAQQIVADSMWSAGAAIGNTGLLDVGYRVWGNNQQRLTAVFGPTSGWGTQNPYQMANAYNAYDTRFGLYSGQSTSSSEGERQIGQWNSRFHDQLNANGVVHRYCTGTGTHSWGYWRADLRDFLFYAYGATPASCPNGWGAPKASAEAQVVPWVTEQQSS